MNNVMKRVDVTDIGIAGLGDLPEKEFFEVGEALSKIEHGLQWSIGDWYNNIKGGDKQAACERAGLNYGHARNCGVVAAAFKMSLRSDILAFEHHKVLTHSDLTLNDRRRLLKKAADDSLSSAKLRAERDIILGISPPHPTGEYDTAVDSLAEAVTKAMPKTASKSAVNTAVRGLRKVASDLKHEFTGAVEKAAEAKARIQRENMKKAQARADEQYERAVKMAAGVKAFMTKEEFLLIRACLHPDKNSHPKAGKAFDIFNRLADVKAW